MLIKKKMAFANVITIGIVIMSIVMTGNCMDIIDDNYQRLQHKMNSNYDDMMIMADRYNSNGLVDNDRIYESEIKSISMRLTPGQDIMTQITKLISSSLKKNKYTALSIVTAVGSVNYCWLRMANQSTFTKIKGPMEIVSLSGTFDLNLSPHVHISLSRGTGQTLGGHLPSLQERQQVIQKQSKESPQQIEETQYDCPIFTTLQLVLLSHTNLIYERKIDPVTTYHELTIRKKHFYSKY